MAVVPFRGMGSGGVDFAALSRLIEELRAPRNAGQRFARWEGREIAEFLQRWGNEQAQRCSARRDIPLYGRSEVQIELRPNFSRNSSELGYVWLPPLPPSLTAFNGDPVSRVQWVWDFFRRGKTPEDQFHTRIEALREGPLVRTGVTRGCQDALVSDFCKRGQWNWEKLATQLNHDAQRTCIMLNGKRMRTFQDICEQLQLTPQSEGEAQIKALRFASMLHQGAGFPAVDDASLLLNDRDIEYMVGTFPPIRNVRGRISLYPTQIDATYQGGIGHLVVKQLLELHRPEGTKAYGIQARVEIDNQGDATWQWQFKK